jgi:hypothetical protein
MRGQSVTDHISALTERAPVALTHPEPAPPSSSNRPIRHQQSHRLRARQFDLAGNHRLQHGLARHQHPLAGTRTADMRLDPHAIGTDRIARSPAGFPRQGRDCLRPGCGADRRRQFDRTGWQPRRGEPRRLRAGPDKALGGTAGAFPAMR